MTEHRSPYQASSQDADQLHLAQQGRRPIIIPEFPPTKPDILLLIPILHSPESPDQDPVCLHLIHLPDGKLSLCNGKRTHTCPCCGMALCREHESNSFITLPSSDGTWSDHYALLCQTCAALSREQIYTFYAFRSAINQ
jgi:hypothetical protein